MTQSANRIGFNKGYMPDGFAERVFHLHLRDLGDHVRKVTQLAIEQYGKEKY